MAAAPLHNPFHCADRSQLVIHEKGRNPVNSVGKVASSDRLSRDLNSKPKSANGSFVAPHYYFEWNAQVARLRVHCTWIIKASVSYLNSASNDGQILE